MTPLACVNITTTARLQVPACPRWGRMFTIVCDMPAIPCVGERLHMTCTYRQRVREYESIISPSNNTSLSSIYLHLHQVYVLHKQVIASHET